MSLDLLQEQREEIIVELKELNARVRKQMSFRHIFINGLIYGVAFVIGSAVIATVLIGIFSPFIDDVPWVRDTFIRGSELLVR